MGKRSKKKISSDTTVIFKPTKVNNTKEKKDEKDSLYGRVASYFSWL